MFALGLCQSFKFILDSSDIGQKDFVFIAALFVCHAENNLVVH